MEPAAAPPLCPVLSITWCLTRRPTQGNIKRDPQGYRDEFVLQWRHYQACQALFLLSPSQDSAQFGELVTFIAQVSDEWGEPAAASCWRRGPWGSV